MNLEQVKTRAKTANKVALEAEKEKDVEKTVEELKRQLQPKRPHNHDDLVMYYVRRSYNCWCTACSCV